MILADKIINLRKKAGWSQEQLADMVGVSRQAISKWESAQSVPDLNRILKLSEVFGVSTDYLLKDDIEEPAPGEDLTGVTESGEKLRPVSMEEANDFLAQNERNSLILAVGVSLCIISPCFLITAADKGAGTPFIAAGFAILLILVAVAVALFVRCGLAGGKYAPLRTDSLDTAYGVEGMVKEKKEKFQPRYIRNMTIGIVLCIVAALPMIVEAVLKGTMSADEGGVSMTVSAGSLDLCIVLVAAAVFLFVYMNTIRGGFCVLLEEGSYTRGAKKLERKFGNLFWSIATILYLVVSFLTVRWDITWIVWPVAGMVYGIIETMYSIRKY